MVRDGRERSTNGALRMERFVVDWVCLEVVQAALSVAYTPFLVSNCQVGGGWYVEAYYSQVSKH